MDTLRRSYSSNGTDDGYMQRGIVRFADLSLENHICTRGACIEERADSTVCGQSGGNVTCNHVVSSIVRNSERHGDALGESGLTRSYSDVDGPVMGDPCRRAREPYRLRSLN